MTGFWKGGYDAALCGLEEEYREMIRPWLAIKTYPRTVDEHDEACRRLEEAKRAYKEKVRRLHAAVF